MKNYSTKVLKEFLEQQPPHLALVRAFEAPFYQKHLPFKGKILDVGCGDGFFAWAVYNQQKIDEGIDVEGSLWKEAKARGNYGKVRAYDGKKIPFADYEFDWVVSNCVLEHVPKAENLINEMARVTKNGGKVLVTVVTDSFGDELLGTKIAGLSYKNWFNKKSIHVSPYNPKLWLAIFKKNNLRIINKGEYINEDMLVKWHDISHYWGIPNLLTRKILNKWVWGPSWLTNQIWHWVFKGLAKIKTKKVKSPYLFIAAEKY